MLNVLLDARTPQVLCSLGFAVTELRLRLKGLAFGVLGD